MAAASAEFQPEVFPDPVADLCHRIFADDSRQHSGAGLDGIQHGPDGAFWDQHAVYPDHDLCGDVRLCGKYEFCVPGVSLCDHREAGGSIPGVNLSPGRDPLFRCRTDTCICELEKDAAVLGDRDLSDSIFIDVADNVAELYICARSEYDRRGLSALRCFPDPAMRSEHLRLPAVFQMLPGQSEIQGGAWYAVLQS